jgi:hypothetical protein
MIRHFAYHPLSASISADGRYEAGIDTTASGHSPATGLRIQERPSGTVLHSLPQAADAKDFLFSADSKYLVFTDANSVDHVFDLEKNSIVASYDQNAAKQWMVWGIFLLGKILGVICLVLALRQTSFEITGFYYAVAVAFFDSASLGMTFWLKTNVPFMASYGCLIAIGAYWACRDRTFWTRLALGLAAFAIITPALWVAVWANSFSVDGRPVYDAWAYVALFVSVTAAVPAYLLSTISGWSLTRTPAPHPTASRSLQFGISSMLVAMLWTSFTLAPIPLWTQSAAPNQFGARFALIGVVAYFVNGILVTLLTWLWFRQWSRRSLIVLTCVGLTITITVLVDLYLRANGEPVERLGRVSFGLVFMLFQLAAFSFPMYLARKHGFHWVKANRQPVVPVPLETTALPADASL